MAADPKETEPDGVPLESEAPSETDQDEVEFPSEVESEIAQLVAGELEQIASETTTLPDLSQPQPAQGLPVEDVQEQRITPVHQPPLSPLVQGGIKGGSPPPPEDFHGDTRDSARMAEPSTDAPFSDPETELAAPPTPPAPPAPPKKPMPQPKIDFAALRRAKTADASNAKASVGRIFGDKSAATAEEITPTDTPVLDPDQSEPLDRAQKGANALGDAASIRLGRGRSFRNRVRIALEWIGRQDPELLRILGMLGLFFLLNGTLIFVLALLGWI